MKRLAIKFNGIGLGCYFYTDYENFKKHHVYNREAKKDNTLGQSAGNGIWVDIYGKDVYTTIVHEISHYMDVVLGECLKITDMEQASELRGRMTGYLFGEISKYVASLIGENCNQKGRK